MEEKEAPVRTGRAVLWRTDRASRCVSPTTTESARGCAPRVWCTPVRCASEPILRRSAGRAGRLSEAMRSPR